MDDVYDTNLHRAVGMSDLSLLLALAFRFPETDDLAHALQDGSFVSDWTASIEDVCGHVSDADEILAEQCRSFFASADGEEMRKEYSRMFLFPGNEVPVWPYETCFLHREAHLEGIPSLFRSRTSLDVERQMREAGVESVNSRTEPIDSAFLEFELLAHMYAEWGEALRLAEQGGEGTADIVDAVLSDAADDSEEQTNAADPVEECTPSVWENRIATFANDHALAWLPAFMNQVLEKSRSDIYCGFADLGLRYLEELKEDASAFAKAEG